MGKNITLAITIFLLMPVLSFAETIALKSGKTIEGKILEKTDTYIKLEVGGIPLTYYLDEINSIDNKDLKTTQPQEIPKKVEIEILNSDYTRPPNESDNLEITETSSIEDRLKKINYYYAKHDFDKAIETGLLALKKTEDKILIARIDFALSSNYLEKGIDAYRNYKDDSFYKLSVEYAEKSFAVLPDNWRALANIGTVNLNMQNWKKAISYYTKTLECMEKNDPSYKEIEFNRQVAEEMESRTSANTAR